MWKRCTSGKSYSTHSASDKLMISLIELDAEHKNLKCSGQPQLLAPFRSPWINVETFPPAFGCCVRFRWFEGSSSLVWGRTLKGLTVMTATVAIPLALGLPIGLEMSQNTIWFDCGFSDLKLGVKRCDGTRLDYLGIGESRFQTKPNCFLGNLGNGIFDIFGTELQSLFPPRYWPLWDPLRLPVALGEPWHSTWEVSISEIQLVHLIQLIQLPYLESSQSLFWRN